MGGGGLGSTHTHDIQRNSCRRCPPHPRCYRQSCTVASVVCKLSCLPAQSLQACSSRSTAPLVNDLQNDIWRATCTPCQPWPAEPDCHRHRATDRHMTAYTHSHTAVSTHAISVLMAICSLTLGWLSCASRSRRERVSVTLPFIPLLEPASAASCCCLAH